MEQVNADDDRAVASSSSSSTSSTSSENNDDVKRELAASDDESVLLDDGQPVDERVSVEDSDISEEDDDDDDEEEVETEAVEEDNKSNDDDDEVDDAHSSSAHDKPRIKLNLRMSNSPQDGRTKDGGKKDTSSNNAEAKAVNGTSSNDNNMPETVNESDAFSKEDAPQPMEEEPASESSTSLSKPDSEEDAAAKAAPSPAAPQPSPLPSSQTPAEATETKAEKVSMKNESETRKEAMELDKPSDEPVRPKQAEEQAIAKPVEKTESQKVIEKPVAGTAQDKAQVKKEPASVKHEKVGNGAANPDTVVPGETAKASEKEKEVSAAEKERQKGEKISEESKPVAAAAVKVEGDEGKFKNSAVETTNIRADAGGASGKSTPTGPLKKKTKLPKLPLNLKKRKLPLKGGDSKVAKAKVVKDGEATAGPDDAVATALDGPASSSSKPASKPKSTSSSVGAGTATSAKKKTTTPSRAVRMPPITSPGLLLPPSACGNFRGAADASGFSTPASLFDQAMVSAGYTTEARTKKPHRGSSVKRNLGDMFDSNVAFTLHFPDLIPKELWYRPKKKGAEDLHPVVEKSESKTPLPDLLLRCLEKDVKSAKPPPQPKQENGNGSRKRPRPTCCQFIDMAPLSLTLPYPESFIQKRLEYVKQVKEREKAIVKYQEKQEELEIKREEEELLRRKKEGEEGTGEKPKITNPIKVPPIPTPPEPPKISELEGLDSDLYEDQHPIYVPKGKKNFVSHLDKNCFHITEGRYFGLNSNFIADPHFVGANAPGISGLTLSCGSGLATSSSASSGSIGVLASTSAIFKEKETPVKEKAPVKKEPAPKPKAAPKPAKKTASLPEIDKSVKNKFKLKHIGPTPTANSSDLKKIMDEGGELAEQMKTCIIRAAVHASRSGKHGQAFLAPNGKAYPDVSKAFAAHAGLKPCMRCKNNKQGVSAPQCQRVWCFA